LPIAFALLSIIVVIMITLEFGSERIARGLLRRASMPNQKTNKAQLRVDRRRL